MLAETFLALMMTVHPGKTWYSKTPAAEGSPLVALRSFEVDGEKVRAFDFVPAGEEAPTQCAQPKNAACSRPRLNGKTKRWERVETWREGLGRYWQISKAAAAVTKGDELLGRYLYVVVKHESGNGRRDVHEGSNHKCERPRDDRPCRYRTIHEDTGRSWGLGQVMVARSPRTVLPLHAFKEWRARDLVGLTDEATVRSLTVPAFRLRKLIKRCGRKGRTVTPACVFVGYAGTKIKASHPLMRARIATFNRLPKSLELGADVRKALGLPSPKKKASAKISIVLRLGGLLAFRHEHDGMARGLARWIGYPRVEPARAHEWIRLGDDLRFYR